jgi:hypothetical protein
MRPVAAGKSIPPHRFGAGCVTPEKKCEVPVEKSGIDASSGQWESNVYSIRATVRVSISLMKSLSVALYRLTDGKFYT